MDKNIVYERDLLYPTENMFEPGSIHVELLSPNKKGSMPVLIEGKTSHSPAKYIDSIIRIMQSDIFDRIHIDVKHNINLYIKGNELMKQESAGKRYVSVMFNGERIEFKGVDDIEV
ncbi:MAG: hypothetical protein N3I35_08625 [Clostridia bacterium]|nr:hypothetical protein [Clostridia bacterium]